MLETTTQQAPSSGGLETRVPQSSTGASILTNWVIDRIRGGWSSKLGYERYRPDPLDQWAPYTSFGYIYALHAAQDLSSGARQQIYFETGGTLYLNYEAPSGVLAVALRTGRTPPTPTDCGSWFTETPYGTVVTNGYERPLLVHPWPLGIASELTAGVIADCARDLGFYGAPLRPQIATVQPRGTTTSSSLTGGGAVSIWNPANGGAIDFGGMWGMGFAKNSGTDPGNESLFGWAVSFIMDTGSEGPRSPMQTTSWTLAAGAEGFRYSAALTIPIGPPGCVARKIYRTDNFSADWTKPDDDTLYFLDIVPNNIDQLYFDSFRGRALGSVARTVNLAAMPAPQARFSALYQSCLWLDGGPNDGRSLYFSSPGLIEEFPLENVIALSSQGGSITALYSNYTSLLVFRENGIDVVRGSNASGFSLTTVSNSVTCRSPHTIRAIPSLGVVFLGLDGFYAITGGLDGGAVLDVVPISRNIDTVMRVITPDCLPRAVSAYSPLTKEYHCYVPYAGYDRPTIGFVLHLDRVGSDGSPWSIRDGFPVGSITTLYTGDLVFGHHLGAEAGPQQGEDPPAGLFVISARRALGGHLETNGDITKYIDNDPPISKFRSVWLDFGDAQILKEVAYTTLWFLTTGDAEVTIKHLKNFNQTPVSERTYIAQPPDQADLPVFDTAILNDAKYRDMQVVPLRVSVGQMSCSTYAFEFETTEDIIFVGWEVEYVSKGAKVIAGKRA